jgi:hypothetical protein
VVISSSPASPIRKILKGFVWAMAVIEVNSHARLQRMRVLIMESNVEKRAG